MLKKSLLLYFFFLSPLLASSENKQREMDLAEIFSSGTPVSIRQETGEEIIARNMHKPEFWSCSDWLKQERPNFSEVKLSSHPLFSAVKETMALADFEVDVLTGFTISVYRPDVQQIISQLDKEEQQNVQDTIFELRKNALRAKYFAATIIDVVEGRVKSEDTLKKFFLDKMIVQIHEAVKLKHKCMMKQSKQTPQSKQKKQLVHLASNGKKTILSPQDPESIASVLNNAFLRSLNSKLRMMRIFLDDLRSKGTISKDLRDILLLSPSLHSFLNHENDDWVNYDIREINDFLGNATTIGIDLKKLFAAEGIEGVSVPQRYTSLSQFSIPKFLLETSEHTATTKKKKKKKKKKVTLASTNNSALSSSSTSTASSAPSSASALASASSNSLDSSSALSSSSASAASSASSSASTFESMSSSSSAPSSALSSRKPKPDPSVQNKKDDEKAVIANTKSISKTDGARTDSHADTIYDIFRPQGYKGLNADKIIAAWISATKKRGFLKKQTGSSHQPLCVVLSDGTRVIMPFFISGSYGPNYMKHVRDAFEAIGHGVDWLRALRYKI